MLRGTSPRIRAKTGRYIGEADIVVMSHASCAGTRSSATDWHPRCRRGTGDQPHDRHDQSCAQAQGARRLIVTGTPVENHLGELWSLMSFANPGLLGTQASFKDRYADYVGTIEGTTMKGRAWNTAGLKWTWKVDKQR